MALHRSHSGKGQIARHSKGLEEENRAGQLGLFSIIITIRSFWARMVTFEYSRHQSHSATRNTVYQEESKDKLFEKSIPYDF